MRKYYYPLVGVLLCLALSSIVRAQSPKFTDNTNLPALRLTYGQLYKILSDVQAQLKADDARTGAKIFINSLTLTSLENSVEFDGDFPLKSFQSAPTTSYSLAFDFDTDGDGYPVSKVHFYLGDDFGNSLSVTGASQADVDALFALLSTRLSQYGLPVIGRHTEMVEFFGIWLVPVGILLLLFAFADISKRLRVILPVVGVALLALIIFPPWGRWLGGVIVYSNNASWLARNEPQLSLVALIIAVAVPTVHLIRWVSRPRSPSSGEPAAPQSP